MKQRKRNVNIRSDQVAKSVFLTHKLSNFLLGIIAKSGQTIQDIQIFF